MAKKKFNFILSRSKQNDAIDNIKQLTISQFKLSQADILKVIYYDVDDVIKYKFSLKLNKEKLLTILRLNIKISFFEMLSREDVLIRKQKSSVIKRINDQYQVRNIHLGTGTYSEVFACQNIILQKIFAIKMISKRKLNARFQEGLDNEKMKQIFEKYIGNSVTMMQKLDHKGVLKLQAFIQIEHYYNYILQYCSQSSICQMLKSGKIFNFYDAKNIILEIIDAFEYLHSLNICHKNINSHNILIHAGSPKITGFALASEMSFSTRNCPKENIDNLMDRNYVAPEILMHNKCQLKSDVWSLGVIFYEILYGTLPWVRQSTKSKFLPFLSESLKFDSRKNVPQTYKEVLTRMLTLNYNFRPNITEIKTYFKQFY